MPDDKLKLARHIYENYGGQREFGLYENYVKAIADTKLQEYVFDHYGGEKEFGIKDNFMKAIYPTAEQDFVYKTPTDITKQVSFVDGDSPLLFDIAMEQLTTPPNTELHIRRHEPPTKEQTDIVNKYTNTLI